MASESVSPASASARLSVPSGYSMQSLVRVRLAEIDAEMKELYARLDSLSISRETISNALQSIFYPVLTIPPEIIAEIFKHCVDSAAPGVKQSLVIASVCRAWRHIALDLRPLWTRLRVPLSDGKNWRDRDFNSDRGKIMECWARRAGGCYPLSVDTTTAVQYISEAPTPDHVFGVLGPYCSHVDTLTCRIQTPNPLRGVPLSNDIRGRIPLLRVLNIYVDTNRIGDWRPLLSFAEAPRLRELTLSAYACVSMPERLKLPWGQLTHLTCSELYIDMCTEIPHLTPHLKTFTSLNRRFNSHRDPTSVRLAGPRPLQYSALPQSPFPRVSFTAV
ncbi:hypothetical protein DFH06DRAFT_1208516 [Mycena polygramma]|nr:hypothetical protein DFH06DRAFT_1208516 [Mycena polygramma]